MIHPLLLIVIGLILVVNLLLVATLVEAAVRSEKETSRTVSKRLKWARAVSWITFLIVLFPWLGYLGLIFGILIAG